MNSNRSEISARARSGKRRVRVEFSQIRIGSHRKVRNECIKVLGIDQHKVHRWSCKGDASRSHGRTQTKPDANESIHGNACIRIHGHKLDKEKQKKHPVLHRRFVQRTKSAGMNLCVCHLRATNEGTQV